MCKRCVPHRERYMFDTWFKQGLDMVYPEIEFVAKEVNDNTDKRDHDACYNYVFSQLWRHT